MELCRIVHEGLNFSCIWWNEWYPESGGIGLVNEVLVLSISRTIYSHDQHVPLSINRDWYRYVVVSCNMIQAIRASVSKVQYEYDFEYISSNHTQPRGELWGACYNGLILCNILESRYMDTALVIVRKTRVCPVLGSNIRSHPLDYSNDGWNNFCFKTLNCFWLLHPFHRRTY